jgi:Flp pilus assembly protein TadD
VGRDSDAVALLAPLATRDSADREVLRALGIAAARAGDRATAARMSARLAAATGRDSALFLHDRAAIAAALGDGDGAVTLLRQAFARGLRFIDLQLHQDPAFAALRGTPAFEALVRPRP